MVETPCMAEGDSADRLRLKAVSGPAAGTEIEVRDELLLGRHAPEPGKLEGDLEISREHARIERSDSGDYLVTDLGSRNGTLVNGQTIDEATVLTVGDKIEVGQTTLVVQYSAPPPPEEGELAPRAFAPTRVAEIQPDPAAPPPEPEPEAPAEEPEEPEEPAEPEPPAAEPEPPAAEPAPTAVEPVPPEPEPAPPPTEPEAPAAEPEEEPAPPPAEPEVEPVGPLSLHVDPESREARLELGGDSEPIVLRWEDGRWQVS
jgi:hypothetical protein